MLGELIEALPDISRQHARSSRVYALLEKVARQAVESSHLSAVEGANANLGPFGRISLPYQKMGTVDSLNLFDLDELIIFGFYWTNRHRYRKTADIGANLGLHSILMSRCGW